MINMNFVGEGGGSVCMCVWWSGMCVWGGEGWGVMVWYNIIKRSHKNNKSSHMHPQGNAYTCILPMQSMHCIARHPSDII